MAHPDGMARFATGLRELQSSEWHKLTDFIVVEGATCEHHVHGIILAVHSGYFKRVLHSKFKEATDRKIVLHDDPPFAVKHMLQYFYRFEYELEGQLKASEVSRIRSHAHMFMTADKYDVPGLKDLALDKFAGEVASYKTIAITTAVVKVTPWIWHYTPPTDKRLRDLVIGNLVADDNTLLACCPMDVFEAAVQEAPDFACDLFPAATGIKMW